MESWFCSLVLLLLHNSILTTTTTPNPTPSPIVSTKTLCETQNVTTAQWCYDINLYPIPGIVATETVSITNMDDDMVHTYFHINIKSIGNHCINPIIDFKFEEIDFADNSEYLQVSRNDGTEIDKCTGTQDNKCGNWISCFNNLNLGDVTQINKDDTYRITIYEPWDVDTTCGAYSINALLTIKCAALPTSTPNPATTDSPTVAPTHNPTPSPTDDPTRAPTNSPTVVPTNNPTPSPTDDPIRAPTDSPTIIPTQSPIKHRIGAPTTEYPTASPTQQLTNSPTPIITDSPSPSPTNKPITATLASLEWELFINDEYDNTEDMLNLVNVTIMDYLDELRVDYDYELNVDVISNKDGVFTINVMISSDDHDINSVDKEALNKQIEDAVMMKHSTTTTMGIIKRNKTNNHEMFHNINDTVLYVIIGCAILALISLLLIIIFIFILRRQQQYLNGTRNGIEKSLNTTSDSNAKQAVIRKVTDENHIDKEHDIGELNEGSDTEQMYDNKYLEVVAETATGGASEVIDNTQTVTPGGDHYVATETSINIEK